MKLKPSPKPLTLPFTLKAGYRNYAVDYGHEGEMKCKRAWAEANLEEGWIQFAPSTTRQPKVQAENMIHELLHVAWCDWGGGRKKMREEEAVRALGRGLATIFRDNPGLMEWIGSRLEDEDSD